MKIITIGRHSSNDVKINDSKVSRHHLQIIRDDAGNFRVVDFGSTNGTYVNDRKISGEVKLSYNDVIRIGNTSLPWQSYFSTDKSHTRLSIWLIPAVCVAATVVIILGIALYLNNEPATTTPPPPSTPSIVVKMREENGVRYIPAKINGQELNFVFDTGASSICISSLEVMVLIKNGTLTENDVLGEERFMDATGRVSVGMKINLRTVTLGNRVLNNVEATVVENPNASCLLGQSVLERFGSYKIDNVKGEIVFE
ncbi:MAG: FHA domain-containing protein [Prevotellaceae bacterium]|jgi:clan AA aspartic protease (TIGR02281 family)|nr:FHA domain-containing protein [Prevotellaceae bacterium]